MNVIIRTAQQSDESQIYELLSQITHTHHAIRPDIFRSDYKCEQSIVNNNVDAPIFIAVNQQDNVVGCLWCVINRERDNSLKVDILLYYVKQYRHSFCSRSKNCDGRRSQTA